MAQSIKEMPTEKLCSELEAAIARLQAEHELLQRLVNNIETGKDTGQCIEECKRILAR
jgi:hypothetical protein